MDDVCLDDEDELTIRAKWSMDGATSLKEAAAHLRAFADQLDSLEADGWQLTSPVDDDWGFIRKGRAADLS
jgi:hypothetical protein